MLAADCPTSPQLLSDLDVGGTIRAHRAERGLHLDTASQLVGIDRAVLSRIERGERPCRVTELQSIARALQTTPATLLQRARRRRRELSRNRVAAQSGNCA